MVLELRYMVPFEVLSGFAVAVLPAFAARWLAMRSRPRPGSMLAEAAQFATARCWVIGVAAAFHIVVFITPGLIALGVLATLCAGLLLTIGFVGGVAFALQARRLIHRTRTEAERTDAVPASPPELDFGVGDPVWVFNKGRETAYRQPAGPTEWARGTPPPVWSLFVGPALDVLYGIGLMMLLAFESAAAFLVWQ